jgi:tetratricopeptide (TPR) repeat protein
MASHEVLRRLCPRIATRCVVFVAVASAVGGCAQRRPIPTVTPEVASPTQQAAVPAADPAALIRQGCFTCLERALAAARDQGLPQLAFEAAALLAIRVKELGIVSSGWRDRAHALAGDANIALPVVEALDAIPADARSGARDETLTQTPRRLRAAELGPRWIEAVRGAPVSAEFSTYMELALTCASDAFSTMTEDDVAAIVPASLRDIPLLRYRLGICGNAHGPALRELRATAADFVDADYALGRYAAQVRGYPDLDEALRLLRSAATAFPGSPAIATTAGDVSQSIEAWTESLSFYDAALALVALHPDALLGRTIVLSNLNRHQDAIDTATRLIDGGSWFLGQAFYWRAWNWFQLGDYTVARQDADRARTLMVNPGVYLLSGMIDWRLRRLPSAEREFQEALRMDFGQCEAAAFLGGVRNEQGQAPEALAAFKQAVQCNDLNITLRREALARVEGADAPAAYKAREVARHQRAIDQAERRRAEAINGVTLIQQYLASIQSRSQPRRP